MTPQDAFAAGAMLGLLIRAGDHGDLHIERVFPLMDGEDFTNKIVLTVEGVGLVLTVESEL